MTQQDFGKPTDRLAVVEVTLILAVIVVCSGWPPPDVNETHYLSKAKSFWNPDWCPRDQFLNSADAHFIFYWTFGWVTCFASLPVSAWIGRLITWIGLAVALRSLCRTLVPIRLFAVFAVAALMLLWKHGNLAGEWVVGGVEAKGFSYVFVLLGLRSLALGRWNQVWPLLGVASAFHVLVGGWSVIAALIAWTLMPARQRPTFPTMLPALVTGFLLAVPGLLPTMSLNWHADAETARMANRIYVFRRLGHHLAFHQFPYHAILRHLLLIACWMAIAWRQVPSRIEHQRLRGFVTGAVVLAGMGFLVDRLTWISPAISASLLRFYWFRLTDAMLPVGLVLAIGSVYIELRQKRPHRAGWLAAFAALVTVTTLLQAVLAYARDPRPRALCSGQRHATTSPESKLEFSRDWIDVCDWIRRRTPPTDVFLTPLDQQSFKWYAQRGEWVSWKDVPQNAEGICNWWNRKRAAQTIFFRWDSPSTLDELRELAEDDGFEWIVLEQPRIRRLGLPIEFANKTFAVCRLD